MMLKRTLWICPLNHGSKTEDPQVLDQSTVNGKVYGQTVWNTLGTTWVVNYNKDIFSKLNLSRTNHLRRTQICLREN